MPILATPKRPDRPDLTIGLNDMLMSIGGRGLRDLNKGSAAALGGMFEQNDLVNEVNRSAALQDYELQVAQMKADEEARLARKSRKTYANTEKNISRSRGKKTKHLPYLQKISKRMKTQNVLWQLDEITV